MSRRHDASITRLALAIVVVATALCCPSIGCLSQSIEVERSTEIREETLFVSVRVRVLSDVDGFVIDEEVSLPQAISVLDGTDEAFHYCESLVDWANVDGASEGDEFLVSYSVTLPSEDRPSSCTVRGSTIAQSGLEQVVQLTGTVIIDLPEPLPAVPSDVGLASPIAAPNPVREGGVVFWYEVPAEANTASLLLSTLDGRVAFTTPLSTTSSRFPSSGRWSPTDESGKMLANGPYLFIITVDGRVMGKGILIVRR